MTAWLMLTPLPLTQQLDTQNVSVAWRKAEESGSMGPTKSSRRSCGDETVNKKQFDIGKNSVF